jgi:hypothetical protein
LMRQTCEAGIRKFLRLIVAPVTSAHELASLVSRVGTS